MTFKIGFAADHPEENFTEATYSAPEQTAVPRKSVVQVHFPARNTTLAYYNDRFDLCVGDMVYVDGRMEGILGHIVEVNYNFKIKLSDYKCVISVVDTTVHGRFFMAGSHFVTFDPEALPVSKIKTWYMAPPKNDDEYASGRDDTTFRLDDKQGMKVSPAIAERGREYYVRNRVKYISIAGMRGYAIVVGTVPYEVEFEYNDGEISGLTCTCFCSYNCKHEFAAMLQLRETLESIEKNYAAEFKRTDCFSAVDKETLFAFAIDSKNTGSLQL